MRSLSQGNFKMAMSSIRATRWRSLLTMMGVIVGIASVVTVVSIGEGIKHNITDQINKLGKDLIIIRPGSVNSSSRDALDLLAGGANPGQTSDLNQNDVRLVQTTAGVKLAAPFSLAQADVQAGNQQIANALIIGTTDNTPAALNQSLQYGSFFSSNDPVQNTAVLGSAIAARLFPGLVPLGRSFSFYGQSFVVRGQFSQFDYSPLSIDADFNNVIFMPIATLDQLKANTPVYEILARPNNPKDTDKVAAAIQSRLLSARGGLQDFGVLKQTASLAASNNILSLLTSFIGGIAAISLIVGGIGIMDVMLVSVSERTREIGIRKAIGATNRQILGQFLTEATILSLLGGIGGLLVSLLINLGLRILTNFQPLIVWQIMLLATVISLLIGIVFGIIPALKAARKDPIEALRYQ